MGRYWSIRRCYLDRSIEKTGSAIPAAPPSKAPSVASDKKMPKSGALGKEREKQEATTSEITRSQHSAPSLPE